MMVSMEMAFMAIVTRVWVTIPDDRHSTRYVFCLEMVQSLVFAKAKKIARVPQRPEYMAMTDAANQAVWYRSFLAELGYTVDNPIPLHVTTRVPLTWP